METARYGRMRVGACVKMNYGYLGCASDVLPYIDSKCSGCTILPLFLSVCLSFSLSLSDPPFPSLSLSACLSLSLCLFLSRCSLSCRILQMNHSYLGCTSHVSLFISLLSSSLVPSLSAYFCLLSFSLALSFLPLCLHSQAELQLLRFEDRAFSLSLLSVMYFPSPWFSHSLDSGFVAVYDTDMEDGSCSDPHSIPICSFQFFHLRRAFLPVLGRLVTAGKTRNFGGCFFKFFS